MFFTARGVKESETKNRVRPSRWPFLFLSRCDLIAGEVCICFQKATHRFMDGNYFFECDEPP